MLENIIREEDIDYDTLQKIKEHASEYEFEPDKKNFLKNITSLEQKIILLNSDEPYEVLKYLDELDMKKCDIILNGLTYEEISKIINLFSSQDKMEFYQHFSHLELVNKFIKQDSNSSEFVEDLTFDRKVELLDSATSNTVEATSIVYDSMNDFEKNKAHVEVQTGGGVSTLSEISSTNDTKIESNTAEATIESQTLEGQKNLDLEQIQIEKENLVNQEDKPLEEELIVIEEKNEEKLEKIIEEESELVHNEQKIDEFSNIIDENSNLGVDLLDNSINDEMLENNQFINIQDNLGQFQQAKKTCEKQEIDNLTNRLENINDNKNKNDNKNIKRKEKAI